MSTLRVGIISFLCVLLALFLLRASLVSTQRGDEARARAIVAEGKKSLNANARRQNSAVYRAYQQKRAQEER